MTQTALQRVRARQELASRAGVAVRVLQLTDDPKTSASDVARAIGTDPLFAARVLRAANAAYYGLSGRVSTLPFAVSVMGFQGLRSLAVMVAAGMDTRDGAPEGFWRAAALSATGGELVAPLLGADSGEAFSIGLLHLVGTAVLHQSREPQSSQDPVRLCLPWPGGDEDLLADEFAEYGIGHDELGAEILAGWKFPPHLCQVIARHHRPPMPDAQPLERTLQIVRVLVDAVLVDDDEVTRGAEVCAWLSEGAIASTLASSIAGQMRNRAEALLDGLRP